MKRKMTGPVKGCTQRRKGREQEKREEMNGNKAKEKKMELEAREV